MSTNIYVQAFKVVGTTLRRCHASGDCTTECDAATQWCNRRVDSDANDQDQILPDIAVDAQTGVFYIVWQDRRYGNDDIFAVRSYGPADGCAWDICWGDDTRISDDPQTSKQASPSVDVVEGIKITEFDWDVVNPGPPPEVVVTWDSEPATYVVVAWEDEREGDPDIYLTYSDDGGETFVQDRRLNDDKAPGTTNGIVQRAPATAIAGPWLKDVDLVFPTPYGDVTESVEVPVTTIHIAWQDFRHSTNLSKNDVPDVYYGAVSIQPDSEPPWLAVMTWEVEQQQANVDDARAWQTGPVWQGEPDVDATLTGETLAETKGYNAFVVWPDGRNYGGDFENLDIYFRLYGNVGAPSAHIIDHNVMVNDGARLHDFDTSSADYAFYRRDMPPHAHQRNPSIASTLTTDWTSNARGYVYVVWDDDRIEDPFMDRNVYFTRSSILFGGHRRKYSSPDGSDNVPGQNVRYGSGAFVSQIFDSGSPDTVWYIADWDAVTEGGTYITLQTRLGNSREEVLASDWYPHERFPYPDDPVSTGAPLLGYDAPGRHIVNAAGEQWPKAQFIQYRINFWARNVSHAGQIVKLNTPCLFDVILHYERPPIVYLPVVLRNH